jgi:hypothetical protein
VTPSRPPAAQPNGDQARGNLKQAGPKVKDAFKS